MTLYNYQLDALSATDNNNKGIVCMPTGTGKTFLEAAIIAKSIQNNSGFNIYVINAPRIILSYQLLKEVYTFLIQSNIEARYMSVHSGGQNDLEDLENIRVDANLNEGTNIKYSEIENGTSPLLIREFINKAKEQNIPVILFSTYNSAERINDAVPTMKIEVVVNDEAHYLVQDQFHDIIHILNSNRCYFFTATTVHTPSDTGRGMNNITSYGEIIYMLKPLEAIQMGKMVRPRMHFVITPEDKTYNREDFDKSLGKIITESFAQHSYAIGRFAKAKMLVSAGGTSDIAKFLATKECKKLIQTGVMIYAVSSNEIIGNNINGEKVSRVEFLKRLKKDGSDPTKELIVLHYAILTEGISIDGLTGVLPLRLLGKAKFLQTYGRIARLDSDDRKRITDGSLKIEDLEDYNKPYAWVIIPNILHEDSDNKEQIGTLITELRDYGFNPYEDIVCSNGNKGLPSINGPEALNQVKKNSPNIGEYIEKVEASYEEERIAKLSPFELMKERGYIN